MIEIKPVEEYEIKKNTDTEEVVYIDDINMTYFQDGDCTQNTDDVQELHVEAVNNGIARFIRFKTGENGWSISEIDDFVKILEDFKRRASL